MINVFKSTHLRSKDSAELSGRSVLMLFCLFFGGIFAVNGYFAYQALSTHTGEVANEPFSQGLAYNTRIAASDRQTKLAWHETSAITRDGAIIVAISDASGTAVPGLMLSGSIGRPSTDREDHPLTFTFDGRDRYVAHTVALAPGSWILTLAASATVGSSALAPTYQSRRRLWLTP